MQLYNSTAPCPTYNDLLKNWENFCYQTFINCSSHFEVTFPYDPNVCQNLIKNCQNERFLSPVDNCFNYIYPNYPLNSKYLYSQGLVLFSIFAPLTVGVAYLIRFLDSYIQHDPYEPTRTFNPCRLFGGALGIIISATAVRNAYRYELDNFSEMNPIDIEMARARIVLVSLPIVIACELIFCCFGGIGYEVQQNMRENNRKRQNRTETINAAHPSTRRSVEMTSSYNNSRAPKNIVVAEEVIVENAIVDSDNENHSASTNKFAFV